MHELTTTTNASAAFSWQPSKAQRAEVAIRARAILAQFWRADDTPDAVQAIELEGWCDVLDGCTPDEVRRAWENYQKTGPRSQRGTLIRPDAGAIHRIVLAARPRPKKAPEPDDSRKGRVLSAWRQAQERLAEGRIKGEVTAARSLTEWEALVLGYYLHGADRDLWSDYTKWRMGNKETDATVWMERFGVVDAAQRMRAAQ